MNRTQNQRIKKQSKSAQVPKLRKQPKLQKQQKRMISTEQAQALKKLNKMTTTADILNKHKTPSVETVDFDEQPETNQYIAEIDALYGQDFDPATINLDLSDDSELEQDQKTFVKEDNALSFHPPVFSARPLKINIANIFDARADYSGATRDLDLRFEIGHDGQNIDKDLDEKSDWIDSHITNNWLDTCMTRYCVNVSKKAKQQKPSDSRQAKARKMHKQTGEKRLAASIRSAIDNTPRFSGFAAQLAQNQQIHGTYAPDQEEFAEYRDNGTARNDYLQQAGTDSTFRHRVLRSLRDSKNP